MMHLTRKKHGAAAPPTAGVAAAGRTAYSRRSAFEQPPFSDRDLEDLGTWEPPVFTKKWMANMVKHGEVLQQLGVDDG